MAVGPIEELEKTFLQYVKKIKTYEEALALIYWDLRTGAPKKGVEQRAEVIGVLSGEVFAMQTSKEMGELIERLMPYKGNLSEVTAKTLEECKKQYERSKKIPPADYEAYTVLVSKAESVWEEAKAKADFNLFRPYLEQIVGYKKKFVQYWGYDGNPYNTLLDLYEPGITVDVLDKVFQQVKEAIVPLVHKINASKEKPRTDFLFKTFPKEKQKAFTLKILEQMGFDFNAGRLDETVHPFATCINQGDVRITTRYDEKDWRVDVFGVMHEGGHALYEQHISKGLSGTPLAEGASMGIHESQSLFYENIIGRSYAFWKKNYALLKQYASGQFDDVPLGEFYRAVNEAKPSLIRIEADMLTYSLHIMVRYEIEKALFNDEISVKDLPVIWNEKYGEYLGVRPQNDGEGVLQDVHWAGGDFGYFPSYALGMMYAAQFKQAMLKDLPDFDGLVAKGDLQPIREWLTEHVHRFGKMKKPAEILRDATGEELNAQYLIDYLTEKFTDVYRLQ
ncbi:carboxypeptidase M32 [Weizmannia acidilactici]|uniref:Metal-dependent carboxypeptidase n=1 Tax=Weizmannia acidilactici TaxID=2607726 RepID=A0A5J4J752_9BACI|nr:carboxypeptidase M32 [Weizmannia acidilactici]GER67878.1 carboxypeptidase M32 [Weizmannia acidilactici]GER70756.1 carboxypeptidase M32 [Weizmannia acidilactici]GER73721.1 carboxypeptidase M32 [Weizmannia acidilactici]